MKIIIPDPTTFTGGLKWLAVLVAGWLVVRLVTNPLAKLLPFVADIQSGGTGSATVNAMLTR